MGCYPSSRGVFFLPGDSGQKILLDKQGHVCYHHDIRVRKFLRGHRFRFENKGLRKRKNSLAQAFWFFSQGRSGKETKKGGERRKQWACCRQGPRFN